MSKSSKMCVGILWTTLLALFFNLVSSAEPSSRNIRLRYRRNSNDEIGKITHSATVVLNLDDVA